MPTILPSSLPGAQSRFLRAHQARRSRWIAANDLTNADFLDDASGNVGVRFKRRQRGGEHVEQRGHCRRRGFNETVSDCDGDSAIELNLGHGVGSRERSFQFVTTLASRISFLAVRNSGLAVSLSSSQTRGMTKAKILFRSLRQDSQDYATFQKSAAHVVSVISFDMQIGDQQFSDLPVEARQPYGTNFEDEPLEVSKISGGYRGPWNHSGFADLCEHYYRSLIGSSGRCIPGNIRAHDNFFNSPQQAELDIPDDQGGAW